MWNCPECGESIEDQFDACWKCAGVGNEDVDADQSPVDELVAVNQRRTCPDCDGVLQPIKMIDATEPTLDREGGSHVELSFAAPDATRSFFLGRIPRLGVVKGFICPSCGRILFYGAKTDK